MRLQVLVGILAVGLVLPVTIVLEAEADFYDFSSDPGLSSDWTVAVNYGVLDANITSGAITWNSADQDLDISSSYDEAAATLYRPGASRADTDAVTLTLKDHAFTGSSWTDGGLVLAANYDWDLLNAADACYRWDIATNGDATNYTLKKGGNVLIFSQSIDVLPASITLDIVRDNDEYVFLANGVEMTRDSSYASTSLPCYGILYASSEFNTLAFSADDFGVPVTVPEPSVLMLLSGLAAAFFVWRTRR